MLSRQTWLMGLKLVVIISVRCMATTYSVRTWQHTLYAIIKLENDSAVWTLNNTVYSTMYGFVAEQKTMADFCGQNSD
jgi:hypothetical protein